MMNLRYTQGILVLEGCNDDLETVNRPHDPPGQPYHRRPGPRCLRSVPAVLNRFGEHTGSLTLGAQ